ncbi:MAG TPA: hypothetical protein VF603_07040 [Allosphingosinicella sp.]
MANNSITAANAVGGNPTGSAAANASNAAGNVSNTAAGTSGSGGRPASAWVTDFCNAYGDIIVYTALAFLVVALLLALGNGIAALRRTWNATDTNTNFTDNVGDPVKFLDALKGLVDALAKAPAWFAMFLGGALLLWVASGLAEKLCLPEVAQRSTTERSNSANGTTNRTSPTTQAGSERTPATNTQSTERPAQRP